METPSSASPSKSDSVQDIIMWLYHYSYKNGDSMLTFYSVSDMCIYCIPFAMEVKNVCRCIYSLTRVVMDNVQDIVFLSALHFLHCHYVYSIACIVMIKYSYRLMTVQAS